MSIQELPYTRHWGKHFADIVEFLKSMACIDSDGSRKKAFCLSV